ncbi:hypothetical protein WK91_19960 [Burkholderia cepacia]|nr:hypothetical protein WK91_19960 [Burkholderia cepacia]
MHLIDDTEVIVEEGLDQRVARAIERHLNFGRYMVGESDASKRRMMIRKFDGTNATIFDNTQIGKAGIRLQDAVDRFEDHFIAAILKYVEHRDARRDAPGEVCAFICGASGTMIVSGGGDPAFQLPPTDA